MIVNFTSYAKKKTYNYTDMCVYVTYIDSSLDVNSR